MYLICMRTSKAVVLVQDYCSDIGSFAIWSREGPGEWYGQLVESRDGMVRETESRVPQELEDIEGPGEVHWANPRTGSGDVDVLVGEDVSQAPRRRRSAARAGRGKAGLGACLLLHLELFSSLQHQPPSPPRRATPVSHSARSTHASSRSAARSITVAYTYTVKMTSTIGIPIKLLNEATVRAVYTYYFSRACSQ